MSLADKDFLLEMHQPRWTSSWVWVGFVVSFFTLQGALGIALFWGWWWLALPAIPVLAHLMHAHLVAFHEASHGTLCPNPRVNDFFGMFIGMLSFMSLSLYRATHHSHHAYLATERDEELWPFNVPGTPRWLRCLAAGAELSLGLLYTPALFLRAFLRSGSPVQNPSVRHRIWMELAFMAAVWAAILTATAWLNGWGYFLVLFLIPALLAGSMQSTRKYIEHMGLAGSTPLSATRSIITPGPVGRLIAFSLFNEPFHGVHHKYARLPQDALPCFAGELSPTRPEELSPYPSYRVAFCEMIKTLSDPRVGPQWQTASQHCLPPAQAPQRLAAG
ncbi:MAG TPA: fatty acid desaturase [Gemmataceae bacterium]|nr:fatty acid desaturase [Gemmataceae bacterium]